MTSAVVFFAVTAMVSPLSAVIPPNPSKALATALVATCTGATITGPSRANSAPIAVIMSGTMLWKTSLSPRFWKKSPTALIFALMLSTTALNLSTSQVFTPV
jgi:hypothetical protein